MPAAGVAPAENPQALLHPATGHALPFSAAWSSNWRIDMSAMVLSVVNVVDSDY
jgi:hypothetical protein